MLVIHPHDRTTAALAALYADTGAVCLTDAACPNSRIRHCLHHTPAGERIMLLGHGSDKGLFTRTDDTQPHFDRIIVGHPHAYYLRRHGANLLGLWCNADRFARAEGLHGLFSGMIVSEPDEAALYGIATSPEELARETPLLARRLRSLLDAATPLADIPRLLPRLDEAHTPLTAFNYANFFYL